MIQEKIFLKTQDSDGILGARMRRRKIFLTIVKVALILFLVAGALRAYDVFWLCHRYLITAYCDCPICVNKAEFRDGKFASRRPVYWGGVAADKSIPFGSDVELIPVTLRDWLAVRFFLGGRRHFTVEDRGGKIRGRHIDIFFPQSRGGHRTALHWGAHRLRVKINGRLME